MCLTCLRKNGIRAKKPFLTLKNEKGCRTSRCSTLMRQLFKHLSG